VEAKLETIELQRELHYLSVEENHLE